jgi:phosphate:Na+ symporter
VISFPVALCLVIGANLGSGILAMINNSAANASARRVALGSLLFKLVGSLIILPFVHVLADAMHVCRCRNRNWLSTSTSSTT